ncbi:MAG: glsA, partial [Bacilli bacterium]|nr:glsA [Bacilli bacterium]
MDNSYSEQLIGWVKHYKSYAVAGKAASYIPALAHANPSDLGICLTAPDGEVMRAGQWNTAFTLQSVSKVINFIAACLLTGIPAVLEHVDVEPTGDAFNSIIRLESHHPGKPFNPMINAGAITVASILPGTTAAEKLESYMKFMEQLLGKRPTINRQVFESEWESADRNRAIAYYLKGVGYLDSQVDVALEVYLKQCAVEATTEDLALIGLILAHDGFDPLTKKQLFPKEIAKLSKSLMVTCGMYNASGNFA